jgi:hypothetical protein
VLATDLLSKYCHQGLDPKENLSKINRLIEDILENSGLLHGTAFQFEPRKGSLGVQSSLGDHEKASKNTSNLSNASSPRPPCAADSWKLLGLHALAEKLGNMEARASKNAFGSLLPVYSDPHWVDVLPMESRRILVRYFKVDEHSSSVCRLQEWWVL